MAKKSSGGNAFYRHRRREVQLVDRIDRKTRLERAGRAINSTDYEALSSYRLDRDGSKVWSF